MSSSTHDSQVGRPAPTRRPRTTKRPNSDIPVPPNELAVKKCRVEDESHLLASPAKKDMAAGSTTGITDLSDNEPDIVDCMIRFLYTNDYSSTAKSETLPVATTSFFSRVYSGQTLVVNTKVYVLAEYLDFPSLRIMYSETPESYQDLKDLALDYAIKHVSSFFEREDFAAFCKGKDSKEFPFEMLKATTGKARKKRPLMRTRLG
ncbi:hypothetical protein BDZ45DRAFT_806376 [Acephala macrosclerotiorum]|nr:hypothetical protein BDZ45DRAFT_806376 [Acephala macrosclerotiorum]